MTQDHIFHRTLKPAWQKITHGKGVYLYDPNGNLVGHTDAAGHSDQYAYDRDVGQILATLAKAGQLDNTLIFYIIGDNGTSAEGGMLGMFNEMTYFNGVHETVQDMLTHYDDWGGPGTYPHMAAGWAVAGDTPFM